MPLRNQVTTIKKSCRLSIFTIISEVKGTMTQSTANSITQIQTLFNNYMSRATLTTILADELQIRLYWRVLTPMVILWGFIFQRLNADHTCDAYVDYLQSGGADELDPDDPHLEPLSKRLCSESSSAYVQGRNRLPLRLIERARQVVNEQIDSWLGNHGRWKGHRVRLLDGTTFSLRPYGDLAERYGQNRNQHGTFYWVKARSVAAFDLFSQAAVGVMEGSWATSETQMVWGLLEVSILETAILAFTKWYRRCRLPKKSVSSV